MLGTRCIGSDERKIYVARHNAAEFNFSLFRCFLKTLHSLAVTRKINAAFFLELAYEIVDNFIVKVIAAETRVTVCCQNLEHAVAYIKNRHIERTAAEVINHNLLIGFLIHSVSKRRSRGFVDYTQNLKTRYFAGVLRCLTL